MPETRFSDVDFPLNQSIEWDLMRLCFLTCGKSTSNTLMIQYWIIQYIQYNTSNTSNTLVNAMIQSLPLTFGWCTWNFWHKKTMPGTGQAESGRQQVARDIANFISPRNTLW